MRFRGEAGPDGLPVHPERLRSKVREKYREVAAQPDAERHSAHGTAIGGAAGLPASAGVLTALGVLGRDRWLTRQVSQREQRMLEEFPAVAELLALAVTAGEGPVGALQRVQRPATAASCFTIGRCHAGA